MRKDLEVCHREVRLDQSQSQNQDQDQDYDRNPDLNLTIEAIREIVTAEDIILHQNQHQNLDPGLNLNLGLGQDQDQEVRRDASDPEVLKTKRKHCQGKTYIYFLKYTIYFI